MARSAADAPGKSKDVRNSSQQPDYWSTALDVGTLARVARDFSAERRRRHREFEIVTSSRGSKCGCLDRDGDDSLRTAAGDPKKETGKGVDDPKAMGLAAESMGADRQ
jgi:hypothetical protein